MRALAVLLVLVLLASCAPEPVEDSIVSVPAEPEQKPAPKMLLPPPQPKEDLAEKLAAEQEEKIREIISTSPKVEPRERITPTSEFWAMYAQNVTSYQFRMAGKGTYFIRADRAKLIPGSPITLSEYKDDNGKTWRDIRLDAVYLDFGEKTAAGYCEGLYHTDINRICAEKELYDVPFHLNYSQYTATFPHEWLFAYLDQMPVREEQEKYYVSGRQATLLVFEDNLQMFIDSRIGLPLRIIVKPIEKYDFEDLVANQAREEDVRHRVRSEIPQEEMFYKPKY